MPLALNGLISDDDSDIADDEQLDQLLDRVRERFRTPNPEQPVKREKPILADIKRLPPFEPGPDMPKQYFSSGKGELAPTLQRDPDVEDLERNVNITGLRGPTVPELNKLGRPPTKRERQEMKKATASPNWFDLPAPKPSELPELYKQVEALRLRRAMDPSIHVRQDSGESKGIKGLPKYFAIGKVIDTPTPFKTRSTNNLTRKERKKSLVDELVADSEARAFAKRKFAELAASRQSRSKDRAFKRKRKW